MTDIEAPGSTTFTTGPVADLFSSYVVTAAISAGCELGLLDLLSKVGACTIEEMTGPDKDAGVMRGLVDVLAWAGIVTQADGQVAVGPRFAAVHAARGYFYWLVRGCGSLFSIAPEVTLSSRRVGQFYQRDMRAVAIGSRLIGDTEVEPLFDTILDGLDFGTVADLGCGSGQRLVRLAGAKPHLRCIGVDIDKSAVDMARELLARAQVASRVDIVEGDALHLKPSSEFAKVDVVMCVFMGHDFWPFDRCVTGLRQLRAAFPRASRLLLCDVVRAPRTPGAEMTIFTLGFELIHALMGVYIPTREEWLNAFHASGWQPVAEHQVAAPPAGILFELRPASAG